MPSYIVSLLWQALALTITHMGTTSLAVGVGLLRSIAKNRSRAMKEPNAKWWKLSDPEWKEIWSGAKITLVLWSLLFVYCVFEASYNNFHACDNSRKEMQSANTQLQNKFNELTVPKLKGEILSIQIAPAGEHGEDSVFTVVMDIKNKGAPSIVEGFVFSLVKSGKEYQGLILPALQKRLVLVQGPVGSPNSKKVVFDRSNWIIDKAMDHPVITGGGTGGFMQAIIYGLSRSEAASPDVSIHVKFSDIEGAPYEAIAHMGGAMLLPDVGKIARQTRKLQNVR